jgi:uncharacterized protein with PIN domain
MKTSQDKLKAEFLAEAEALFDRLMEWDEQTAKPNLTQIEEIVLELRQRLGKQLAHAVLARQENSQPAERMRCAECQGELEPKGPKRNRVESQIGSIQMERSYYYCPRCRQGFFPSGSATTNLGETLE